MVDTLSNMEDRGLLSTGQYVLIHVDLGTLDRFDPLKYFKSKNVCQFILVLVEFD